MYITRWFDLGDDRMGQKYTSFLGINNPYLEAPHKLFSQPGSICAEFEGEDDFDIENEPLPLDWGIEVGTFGGPSLVGNRICR